MKNTIAGNADYESQPSRTTHHGNHQRHTQRKSKRIHRTNLTGSNTQQHQPLGKHPRKPEKPDTRTQKQIRNTFQQIHREHNNRTLVRMAKKRPKTSLPGHTVNTRKSCMVRQASTDLHQPHKKYLIVQTK